MAKRENKANREYWQGRQEQWWSNQDQMDARAIRKLELEYKRMSREIEKEIAVYFAKYGKNDVIDFRILMETLSADDRILLFQNMDEFARRYPKHAHLMPIRESIYKLNRLQGLHYSINLKLLELGAIEQEIFEKHLLDTYGKAYAAMMKDLGLGQSFVTVSNETMIDTIYQKWVKDENFSDRIWLNKEKMIQYVQTDLRDAIARGDGYRDITKRMSERFQVGNFEARRLITTESAFVLNQSHSHAYINAGVVEYELSAVIDRKTSRICQDMDGKRFKFEDAVVGLNFPPFHVFCRTTFIGILDGMLD